MQNVLGHSSALRAAVDKVGSELFTIVHNPRNGRGAKSLKRLAPQAGLEPATLRLTAGKNGVSRALQTLAMRCRNARPHSGYIERFWTFALCRYLPPLA